MLSEQEKKEIEAAAGHYPMKRAAGIDALKIVQKHRGWISDDVLSQVADVLEMSATDLDAVATLRPKPIKTTPLSFRKHP